MQNQEKLKINMPSGIRRSRFLVDLAKNIPEEGLSPLASPDKNKPRRGTAYLKGLKPKPSFCLLRTRQPKGDFLAKGTGKPENAAISGFFKALSRPISKAGFLALFILAFNFLLLLKLYRLAKRIRRPKARNGLLDYCRPVQEKPLVSLTDRVARKAGFARRFRLRDLLPRFQAGTLRSAFVSCLIFIVVILPVKGFAFYLDLQGAKDKVISASEQALGQINAAGASAKAFDFTQAESDFSKASLEFSSAKEQISDLSVFFNIISRVLPIDQARMAGEANHILEAGSLSAQIGIEFSEAFQALSSDKKSLKSIVETFSDRFGKAGTLSVELRENVKQIDAGSLPLEYRQKFTDLQAKMDSLVDSLNEINDILAKAKIFLGFDYGKRYLVVFQNNTEMRATGGFIGSYALVDFLNGEIRNIEVPTGGSYDTEGGMKDLFAAPEPLSLLNPLWFFWDSNWWPDWPTSAEKLAFFLEKSSGPSVDGVISFTPTVIEKLLNVMGPITLPKENNLAVNSQNFWQVAQTFSEQKPLSHPEHQDNPYLTPEINSQAKEAETMKASSSGKSVTNVEPKRIIGDMLDEILRVLPERMNKEMFVGLLKMAESSFSEKQILLFFKNGELEKKADDYDWSGRMKGSGYDYLQVVHTNIGGGKSDRQISEKETLESVVQPDGTVENILTIKRTHNGIRGERFTGVRNVDWLRVYVPKGAKLHSAEGFSRPDEKYFTKAPADSTVDPMVAQAEKSAVREPVSGTLSYDDLGKTVFANWLMVDPGESATIVLKYQLPFKFKPDETIGASGGQPLDILNPQTAILVPYSLLWQKQAGAVNVSEEQKLTVDSSYKKAYELDPDKECASRCQLDKDKYWAWVFRK